MREAKMWQTSTQAQISGVALIKRGPAPFSLSVFSHLPNKEDTKLPFRGAYLGFDHREADLCAQACRFSGSRARQAQSLLGIPSRALQQPGNWFTWDPSALKNHPAGGFLGDPSRNRELSSTIRQALVGDLALKVPEPARHYGAAPGSDASRPSRCPMRSAPSGFGVMFSEGSSDRF